MRRYVEALTDDGSLAALLDRIIARPAEHARLLNTFSRLEYVGVRKMLKSRRAENYLALLLPRNFESTRAIASSISQIFVFDLPADFYQTYNDRVHAVSSADLKRAADTYIRPDKFAVVVIGDLKKIEAGVRALNLGAVTVVKPEDVMK